MLIALEPPVVSQRDIFTPREHLQYVGNVGFVSCAASPTPVLIDSTNKTDSWCVAGLTPNVGVQFKLVGRN